MKQVLLLLILVSFSVCIKINVDPKKTWKSRTYKRDYKPFLKTIIDAKNTLPKKEFKKLKDLPESYDLRTAYPKCQSIQEVNASILGFWSSRSNE